MRWETVIDTADEDGFVANPELYASDDEYALVARSLSVLQLATDAQGEARTASWRKSGKAPLSTLAPAKKEPATPEKGAETPLKT